MASWKKLSQLVDRANDWLKKNVDVQVKTCESMTWMSRDAKDQSESELMELTKRVTEEGATYCVRGLRLWLIPQSTPRPQHICFNDIIPTDHSVSIQDLVSSANVKIDQEELKGQVLTVETIGVRTETQGSVVDSDRTRWVDHAREDCPYAFVLRIFYNKEINGRIYGCERAQIGIKDIVPLPTDDSYEGFEDLIERANCWVKDQTDILITNIQSVMVQKNKESHFETGSDCFYCHPGVNRSLPVDFFRIIRVAYRKPIGELLISLPVVYPLAYETFTPELVKTKERKKKSGGERLEKMNETFAKAAAFVQHSGAEVISAETVMNPMQMYSQENEHAPPPTDEMKFLLTLRLYLSGKPSSADAISSRSGKRSSVTSGRPRRPSSEENEHPGPIFLRHVVTRRFKYRWLVLAVTVITCMTIVVVVSVVYSNL